MRLKFWGKEIKIRVFVLADHDLVYRTFAKNKLVIFPLQLRRAKVRQVFSGIEQVPELSDYLQEMSVKIKSIANAISYVETNPNIEDIYVLEIK